MTALVTTLVTAKPREKAGSRTGSRYAFQAHVSLAKMLELRKSGVDYRAVFDHFDDLAILVPSNCPNQIEFFQIKGKQQGSWTAASLCKLENEVPKSIVGKMYYHTQTFGSSVAGCVFLTNASFGLTLADGTKTGFDHTKILYGTLGSEDKTRFTAALEADFPSPRSPAEDAVLSFERTVVPVTGYDLVLKGMLVDAVENKQGVVVAALYRTLIQDITGRANDTTVCLNLSDVFTHKSLGCDELDQILAAAEKRRGILDAWTMVDDELKAAGRTPMERIKSQTAVVTYLRDRSMRTRQAEALAAEVYKAFQQVSAGVGSCDNLLTATDLVRIGLPPSLVSKYEPAIIEAAILVELYESFNG
ncbi:dsDNA nuclease domain-containing protein [Bradyrhizobium sp. ORS 86]|uniref:dsDNA nuclease domain-containing protein n=1 Tax=Bradyrhizobium sp. ORS 86 TaxID=1685970 RepID=UPI00388DDBB5